MSGRPQAYGLAYWAPAPGLLTPMIRVTWRYRRYFIRLPQSCLWPPLIIGEWMG